MEKIFITDVSEKTTSAGKRMWAVEYNGKDKFNLFENKEQEAIYFKENMGKEVEVDFEMSKCGKYKNLKSVNMNHMPETNPSHEAREGCDRATTPEEKATSRDDKIVAQVILKCASELTKEMWCIDWSKEATAECICNNVNELTGAYKLALSNLKAL